LVSATGNASYANLPVKANLTGQLRSRNLRLNLFYYIIKLTIVLIIGHFSTFAKVRGKIKILRKRANSAAQLKILQPVENCGRGPY